MRRTLALLGVLAVAATVIHAQASQDRHRRTHHGIEAAGTGTTRFVIAAAGDTACQNAPYGSGSPANCQYDDTAHLIDAANLARVLLLGDNQYDVGAFAAYMSYFDPTWGRAKPNLAPAPGNHEYANDPSSRPRGYFRYFGVAVRGPDGLGYYSYDVGACPGDPCWHLISLNSELCFAAGGCGSAADPSDPGPGNRMYAWLAQDLADHPDSDYPRHPRLLAPSAVLVLHRERRDEHGGPALAVAARGTRRRRAERSLAQLPALAPHGPERRPRP